MPHAPILWTPTAERIEGSELRRFERFLAERTGLRFATYAELHAWSVAELETFWGLWWDFIGVRADGDRTRVLARREMPGARWFPDVALNYGEHLLAGRDPDALALQHASESQPLAAWTWGDLHRETARIRAGLVRLGVGRGDRVAAYLPNVPQAIAALLATASLGAIWSSCSPDFGARTVIDRFAQIEPKVLLAVDGYRYGGRDFDRGDAVADIAAALPSLQRTATLPYLTERGDWPDVFPATDEPVTFERVPFDHPLYVLYSSGTTGLPKAIVHGHGGVLLEHPKWFGIHADVKAGDRLFWFTTTGWMMWNALVSGLATGASIVLYDGSPAHPGADVLWDLVAASGATCMGVGAAYLHGCLKAGVKPRQGRDLSALNAIGSTGSPLSPEGFQWVYDEVGGDVWLFSTSGGTDVCSAFVGGVPSLPVRSGEIQARHLASAIEAFDEAGRSVIDEVGELVLTAPLPSMPVGFWNDPDGSRYHDAYFSMYPGVWRHGDWIRITPEGGCVIYGRSDSTINRSGVRIGTSEIYRAALAVEAVVDALVVDVPRAGAENEMLLFVVLAGGAELTDAIAGEIRALLRRDCSPRHVPDEIVAVAAVPRTLSGKLLEVPVKRLLEGVDPAAVASRDSLADPVAFDWFVDYARARDR